MNQQQERKFSKFLSLILRHNPGKIGLQLDQQGWANVQELIEKVNKARKQPISLSDLEQVVANDNKQRYSFTGDKSRIRANQGHSINIDLGLEPQTPPAVLFHGTASRFLDSIMEKGLLAGSRQHVHLSLDIETATNVGRRHIVGKRHGNPVILKIDTFQMLKDGHLFYLSDNNVWLTDHVPVKYLSS